MKKLILLVASLTFLACGGSDSTGVSANLVGVWNLQSVDGSQLPFTVAEIPGDKLEITASRLTANADFTWSEITTFRETQNGTVTTTTQADLGAWSQSNNAVTLTSDNTGTATGALAGNTLTINAGGTIGVYRRQ